MTLPELLRLARNGAYRLGSPLDTLRRRIAGNPSLPPLWLRRHAGAVSRFESSAVEMTSLLDSLGLPAPDDDVLDVGCGPGAMAEALRPLLGPRAIYVGFDVHAPSIEWCRKRFAGDSRFSFEVAAIASPFGSGRGAPLTQYRFPLADAAAGLVLAKSVFTHLRRDAAAHYLSEISRVLRRGRAAVVTAFLFEGASPAGDLAAKAFPHSEWEGDVRWKRRSRPEAGVAYEATFFHRLVADAGLRVQWMSSGFFPGSAVLAGQDVLFLGH